MNHNLEPTPGAVVSLEPVMALTSILQHQVATRARRTRNLRLSIRLYDHSQERVMVRVNFSQVNSVDEFI